MGKVYREPKGIEPPDLGGFLRGGKRDMREFFELEREYEGRVREWARANGSGKCRGEVVRFGVADGKASYVVLSLRPVRLIHLSAGDGYRFPYVERLTASDIRGRVESERSLAKLFESGAGD